MRRNRAYWGLCAAFCSLIGCDPEWELALEVTVPADVQADYEAGYPAQVVIMGEALHDRDRSSVSDISPRRIGILCDASDEDQVFQATLSSLGCTVETKIVAWLQPLTGGDAENPRCGSVPQATRVGDPALRAAPADAPQAEAIAFRGKEDADCNGSQGEVSLVLE